MTEINWQLLDECMDFIEANPERWNQGDWGGFVSPNDRIAGNECGTQFCLAGTACYLSGMTEIAFVNSTYGYAVRLTNDEGGSIPENARDLLGITLEQSRVIFRACPPYDPDYNWRIPSNIWNDPSKFRQFVYDYLKNGNFDDYKVPYSMN